jgi:hypothetical protein
MWLRHTLALALTALILGKEGVGGGGESDAIGPSSAYIGLDNASFVKG